MVTIVREPFENEPDGYIGIQPFERTDYHSLWTKIEECVVPYTMYYRVADALQRYYNPRMCEVYVVISRHAELVIWIQVPNSHSSETLRRYARAFAKILRKLGLMINPMFCPIHSDDEDF